MRTSVFGVSFGFGRLLSVGSADRSACVTLSFNSLSNGFSSAYLPSVTYTVICFSFRTARRVGLVVCGVQYIRCLLCAPCNSDTTAQCRLDLFHLTYRLCICCSFNSPPFYSWSLHYRAFIRKLLPHASYHTPPCRYFFAVIERAFKPPLRTLIYFFTPELQKKCEEFFVPRTFCLFL